MFTLYPLPFTLYPSQRWPPQSSTSKPSTSLPTPTDRSIVFFFFFLPSCFFFLAIKMGNWELSRVPPSEPLPDGVRDKVFTAYKKATELEDDNYKAWHSWAMVREN